MANVLKKPLYQVVDGIRIPPTFPPKSYREVLNYQPRAGDVFIVTYPKCGTTWMQNIALYIFRKGQALDSVRDFCQASPFIDRLGLQGIERMPRPGAFKTHTPFNRLHFSPEAKYIIVIRNPKDCCVSFYHHTKVIPGYKYHDGNFDDFFELFMAGEVEFDDYFDHLLAWYPLRNSPNVFYTTYERMKEDMESVVLQLAKFLGDEYIDALEKDNTALKNVIYCSSFSYMKENLRGAIFPPVDPNTYEGHKYSAEVIPALPTVEPLSVHTLLRKGQVGDWKNYFSQEQLERLQKKFDVKTEGTDIASWWSNSRDMY